MWTGLSAFPLTPMNGEGVDEAAFAKLVQRLRDAQVDSIGVLGSTGNYAYLSCEQRQRVIEIALALSATWQPLWDLFAAHGSLRVIATAAELLGLVRTPCLPHPCKPFKARNRLAALLTKLEHIG